MLKYKYSKRKGGEPHENHQNSGDRAAARGSSACILVEEQYSALVDAYRRYRDSRDDFWRTERQKMAPKEDEMISSAPPLAGGKPGARGLDRWCAKHAFCSVL